MERIQDDIAILPCNGRRHFCDKKIRLVYQFYWNPGCLDTTGVKVQFPVFLVIELKSCYIDDYETQ